jgi:hypothetical protein
VRQGKTDEAIALLEAEDVVLAQRGTPGWIGVGVSISLAEAYLAGAEEAVGDERAVRLQKAALASGDAVKQASRYHHGIEASTRVRGTYEWLSGDQKAAQRLWQRSLSTAEKLGASYELGLTHLELGKRLNDEQHLQKAAMLFAEIGASADLALAQQLLSTENFVQLTGV